MHSDPNWLLIIDRSRYQEFELERKSVRNGGMKMESVHEFVFQNVALLLIVGLSSAHLSALISAEGAIQFQLSDGDNVTCIAIDEQTSLQNCNGTGRWNWNPTTEVAPGNSTNDAHGSKQAQQTLTLDGAGCPDGFIPVRADRGVWDIGISSAKPGVKRLRGHNLFHSFDSSSDPSPHNWAIGSILGQPKTKAKKSSYKGTEVFINVWKPFVESQYEFSLAQLWLVAGKNSTLNTIEVGYQVSSGHYGDGLPRLFVYWTADGYNNTGCYDLECPGFVQVSKEVLIGGSFTPISRHSGQQYEIKLRVFKDGGTGDWWLQLNDENVGYWPKDIFGALQDSADLIEWGGEIVDDEGADGNLHTRTQMGSGQFANKGYRRAAYQRNLQYIDHNNNLVDARFFVESIPNATCYSAEKGTEFSDWGSYFFFGGKGRNPECLRDPAFET